MSKPNPLDDFPFMMVETGPQDPPVIICKGRSTPGRGFVAAGVPEELLNALDEAGIAYERHKVDSSAIQGGGETPDLTYAITISGVENISKFADAGGTVEDAPQKESWGAKVVRGLGFGGRG